MIVRNAEAAWKKNLKQGSGTLKFANLEMPYSFASRFEQGEGTNPDELIGAAHAGCFSMALALVLGEAGHEPEAIRTSAKVYLDADQLAITKIELRTEADVPGLDAASFREHAEAAKANCPVSKALAGTEIVLEEAYLAEKSEA